MHQTLKSLFFGTLIFTAASSQAFSIKSDDFVDGSTVKKEQLYDQGECKGKNESPQLSWSDLPKGTQSIAVTLFDPDSVGNGWWHWVVVDIPATATSLPTGAGDELTPELPAGAISLKNDFGTWGYGGPCPPKGSGKHRYQLTVYAMKEKIPSISKHAAPTTAAFLLRNEAVATQTIEVPLER